jgi:hypothetical protein
LAEAEGSEAVPSFTAARDLIIVGAGLPVFDPDTLETNVPGLFVAGGMVG